MSSLTDNEVNNIVYLFIKFGLQKLMPDAKKPCNALIKEIMLAVSDNPTRDNITKETIIAAQNKYDITILEIDVRGLEEYMKILYAQFIKLPEDMRNDLGTDKEDDTFNTKH